MRACHVIELQGPWRLLLSCQRFIIYCVILIFILWTMD